MNNYKVITLTQFQELIRNNPGSHIITFISVTRPKVVAGAPPDLVKIACINGIIGCDYTSCVNNQRRREGCESDFVAQPRSWGTRLFNSSFVSHVCKDGSHKLYLEVKVQKVFACEYKVGDKPVKYDDIKQFLYERDSEGVRQGVDREIVWRDYTVDNIVSVDMLGEGYIIKKEN